MSNSRNIIEDLLSGDSTISDPSDLLPDLKTVFQEGKWSRDALSKIVERHRQIMLDRSDAT